MISSNKSTIVLAWLVLYALAVLLVNTTDAFDCDRYCKTHRVNIGNCRCRPDLFVKKRMPSETNDLSHDFLLKELLREYLADNDIIDDKK